MSSIAHIEDVITEYAGPFAKFVVSKQINEMGLIAEKQSKEELSRLVDRVVKAAIFDPKLQKDAIRKLKKNLELYEDVD